MEIPFKIYKTINEGLSSFFLILLTKAIELHTLNLTQPVMSILRIIFAIILPPLGVFLTVGIKPHFWLNILLTILGFIPGIVHAVWIIAKND